MEDEKLTAERDVRRSIEVEKDGGDNDGEGDDAGLEAVRRKLEDGDDEDDEKPLLCSVGWSTVPAERLCELSCCASRQR